ncbi:MAG: response regulator transcription factor [Chloroflexi bacterium]|nr:response regulator transcription factor [Chloroflexota bacterium]
MTIRVLLVDDHPVVLGGLGAALQEQDGIDVVARVASRKEAAQVLATLEVDVALVDIRLPDGSGLDLISTPLPSANPAWIVLSSFDNPQYVVAAVKLGAAGYLLKTAPLQKIVDAVRAVAAGGTTFEARQLRAVHGTAPVTLSAQERSVMREVLAGRSNAEISAKMGIAQKTVEAHLTRLFDRFQVTSRLELALRAEREGWLDVS